MIDLLTLLLSIAIMVFAASSMLSVGFRYSAQEIIEPFSDTVGVITTVIANFVAVPLLAFGILWLIPLDQPMAIGLIVCGAAAGAPMLIKLTQLARENEAFAASMLVLLLLVTMVYMPIVIPLIGEAAAISGMSIAQPLFVTMLLPLIVAFLVRAVMPGWAGWLLPYTSKLTNIAMAVMLVLTVVLNLDAVIAVFGQGAILAAILLVVGAFLIGYLLGTVDQSEKMVLGFGTANRNFAAATVVASQSFSDPAVLVMTIVISTLAMVMLIPAATAIGSLKAEADAGATREKTQG